MNLICIIPLIIGFFSNAVSAFRVKKRAESRLINPYIPLPDLVHDYFPNIPLLIPDYFLLFCTSLAIIYYNSLLEIEKNLLCIGLCAIIRSFSVFLTILPTCVPKPNEESKSLYATLFLSTHDLMFSGHSLLFIGIGKMLNSFFIQVVGPLFLVLARQHYTIDVCVSGLVYFFVFQHLDTDTFYYFPYSYKIS
jgi:hypothetical protein